MPRGGERATHVADSTVKSKDPHGDGRGAHGALDRLWWGRGKRTRRVCVFPLGEASHDAETASVAVVEPQARASHDVGV